MALFLGTEIAQNDTPSAIKEIILARHNTGH